MAECLFTNYVVVGSNPVAVTYTSDLASVSSKEFLDIQVTLECRFTLKHVRDMIRTYNEKVVIQLFCLGKYSLISQS